MVINYPFNWKKKIRGPRKAEDLKHTEIVAVRFTRVERQMLELYVRRENMKLTAFVRSCAILYAKRCLDDETIFRDVQPEDMSAAKASVAGMIEDFKLATAKSMASMDEQLACQNASLMALARHLLFYVRIWEADELDSASKRLAQHWDKYTELRKYYMRNNRTQ
jgi:hypothetical protein